MDKLCYFYFIDKETYPDRLNNVPKTTHLSSIITSAQDRAPHSKFHIWPHYCLWPLKTKQDLAM
jgi:hypothetical protein